MELQHLHVLTEDVRGGARLLVPQELVVGLEDVRELVGQIVLVLGRAEHDDSRADAERRHRQARYEHPIRAGELGVHPQDVALLLVDLLEDLVSPLRRQDDLLLVLEVLVGLLPLRGHLETDPPDVGLVPAAAPVGLDRGRGLVGVVRVRVHFVSALADLLALAEVIDVSDPLPGLPLRLHDDLLDLGVGGGDEELAAVEADTAEDLHGLGHEAGVEDRLGQVDVPEVAGALRHVTRARLAPGDRGKVCSFWVDKSDREIGPK